MCRAVRARSTSAARSAAASLSNARKSAENFLDFAACACYNTQAAANIRSGIEVVITALTRNQVYRQRYRGFESHPLRQIESALISHSWNLSVRFFYVSIFLCFNNHCLIPSLSKLSAATSTTISSNSCCV